MKKHTILAVFLAVTASAALATETVHFSDNLPSGVWDIGTNTVVTQSWNSVEGNVNMDLIISSAPGELYANGSGDSLRIFGGLNTGRIDSATTNNLADDESLTFKLNVSVSSGPAITNISLNQITLNSFGSSDAAEFGDGSATFNSVAASNAYDYAGLDGNVALSGLTALSSSTVGGLGSGTWQLSVAARDALVGGTGAVIRSEFQFDGISFNFERNGNVAPVVTTKSITNKFDAVRTAVMNAIDPDTGPSNLVFSIITGPSYGSLGSIYDDKKIDYIPTPGFIGSDSFDFAANDGNLSSTGTITIVTLANMAPVADDQNLNAVSTVPLIITLTGSDNEGQDLTYAILDNPTDGTLSGPASNSTTYTSDEGFTGADSFTFSVTDTEGSSSTGTVSITVTPNYKYVRFEEDMPGGLWPSEIYNGVNKSYTAVVTKENITFSLTVEALDMSGGTDQGTAKLDSNGANNTLGIVGAGGSKPHRIESNGTQNEGIKFTLSVSVPSGFTLDDIFLDNLELNTWDPADTADFSDGTTTTNISPTDTAYDYHNYTGNDTDRGDTGVINLANLGLPPLSTNNVGGIGSGVWELSLVAVGDPTDFAIENIDFGFVVNALVNNPPVADNQSVSLEANEALDITITASDAEPLTFAILDDSANGSLGIPGNLTGSSADITYTPDLNYIGADSFTFTATDGELSSTGTVSITVTPDYLIAGIGERYVPGSGVTFNNGPDIDYGSYWVDSGTSDTSLGTNYTQSVTDTVNDIVFSLTLTSVSNNTMVSDSTREDVGIGSDGRIDAGEGAIEATVSVSGAGAALLNSLELERFYVRRWGNGEVARFSDGTTTIDLTRPSTGTAARDYMDYTGNVNPYHNLSALTPLTKNNTLTWSLSLDATAEVGIGAIGFRYTIKLGQTTYGLWAADYPGIGGPNDDTGDSDGMDNLLEYALGGDPTADDAEIKLPNVESDGSWFYYIHNQRDNDNTLTYTVQLDDNLVYDPSWDTNGVEYVNESDVVDDFKSVTNRTDVDSTEFFRLKVEQN